MKKNKTLLIWVLLACAVFINWQCAYNPVTGKKEFSLMSHQQEIALGKQSDPSVIATFGLYEDQNLQRFIDRKGQQMARISHRPDLPYEFKVVDSPVVNAFAVPGGFVYFTRGIMAHFNNEAEFAGVLGHEIGHITARHSARQYSSQMLGQVGFMAGMVFSEKFRQYGQLANTGMQLAFLKFGRDHESQSDKLGVDYSTQIGYDAREMAGFFETLDRMRAGSEPIPSFLSTHPDPADRERKVRQMAIKEQQKSQKRDFKVNRDKYLRMIDGLIYGADPKQGYVENNTFYHPVLKFQFPLPNGWGVNNTPSQLQVVHPDGNAAILMSLAQGKNPQSAAQTAIQNNQMQVQSQRNTRINGLNAYEVLATANEGALQLLAYYIQYDGNIYQMIGLSEPAAFRQHERQFRNSIERFDDLNDPSKLNRQPERVRIKEVRKKATLRDVLREHSTPNDRLEELAILNGMQLTDRVNAGMLIKTIGK